MLATLKTTLKRVLGERTTGRLEYWLRPGLKRSWGGPLNGQIQRQRIFDELWQKVPLQAIVETGTFRGTTTVRFAECGVPIHTVEASPRYHAFAELRLRPLRDKVDLQFGDSRSFLRSLAARSSVPRSNVFFYLDAHWEEDLPLREEVDIIFSGFRRSVVMVDDFEVPGTRYAFDDYGPDKVLNLAYLAPLGHLKLSAFFPRADVSEETGARRGCVVLCDDPEIERLLSSISSLTGPTPIR
jgi:hypothetical protein